MKIFILEDDISRIKVFEQNLKDHDVTICMDLTTAWQSFDPPYDIVCLDHDLGGMQMVDSFVEETGYTFAVALGKAKEIADIGRIFIHSYNPVGAMNMERALYPIYGVKVQRIPFGPHLMEVLLASTVSAVK